MSEPTIAEVRDAQSAIRRYAVRTPLLESPLVNESIGGRLLVKAEALQTTGSFKLRGALNRISRLSDAEKARGIVAYSSGNHAQAVAYGARVFGTRAIIVMPEDAPATKVAKTRAYGGDVVFYDRYNENRTETAHKIRDERGATLIPPYDDPHVIAGQGTVGLEVVEQAAEMDTQIDAFLVCCAGGGLTAGCALALEAAAPQARVFGVEPEGFDDTRRSLEAGTPVANDPGARSICDAILIDRPGSLTFPINQRLLAGVLVVSDAEAMSAMATAQTEYKIAVEPGGAVALAAALTGKLDVKGKTVAVVCTGGNVDPAMFIEALQTGS